MTAEVSVALVHVQRDSLMDYDTVGFIAGTEVEAIRIEVPLKLA